MASETQKSDSLQALALKVFLAPAHFFVCRRVELPADVQPEERESAALLQLEEISPFPLEHLLYGYKLDASGRHAFVFAAYKRRFTNDELLSLRPCEAALPEFAVALLKGQRGEAPLAVIGPRSIAYFEFDDVSELPVFFHGMARPETAEADEGAELRALFEAMGDRTRPSACRVWRTNGSVSEDQGRFLLSARDQKSDTEIKVRVERETLWTIDLRDSEAVEKAKADAARSVLFWRVIQGVAALIALFVIGELIYGLSFGYLKVRRHWNAEQAPLVASIEGMQNTVTQLDDFQGADLAPFEMLIAIDPYRPAGVVFMRVETAGPNSLVIEARAQSASQVNEFGSRLKAYGNLQDVAMTDILPRADGTTFKARVSFVPGAFNAPEKEVAANG